MWQAKQCEVACFRTVRPHGCGRRAYRDVFTACPETCYSHCSEILSEELSDLRVVAIDEVSQRLVQCLHQHIQVSELQVQLLGRAFQFGHPCL